MNRSDQDYTDLIADARVWPRDGVSKGPLINALADAIEALVKERDEQGSCWDEGMTLPVREGGCAPMPPKCELPHGHGGAHRAGRVEWMRRDSYNSVVAERDELKREMHARELHHFEEEQKSAELAAEVERLRLVHAGQSRLALSAVFMADVDDDEGVQAFRAEWVRNHDAALIESLADAWSEWETFTASDGHRSIRQHGLSPNDWLRARAQQIREGGNW